MLFLPMAFCAGVAVTLQTTLNGQLAKGIGGDSVIAALFSFIVSAGLLAGVALLRGGVAMPLAAIPSQPAWMLAGGLLGACALLSKVFLTPKIGLISLLGLVIAGQLISSLLIDHFALFGSTYRPVSWVKLGGSLLMLAGLAISLFGDRLFKGA